jgi:hypothetical protein
MQIFKKTLFPCKIEVLGVVNIRIKYLLHSMAGYHFPMIMAEQKNKLSYCNMKQLKRAFTIGELMPVVMVSRKSHC